MTKGNIINIIENYFLYVGQPNIKASSPTTNAIVEIYNAINQGKPTNIVTVIDLKKSDEINKRIEQTKKLLSDQNNKFANILQPFSYFISEITDNMQQHSNTDLGYIFANYNQSNKNIEIVLADGGISIYGSYVNAQKFIENIKNSDIIAVEFAKNGYSTKDRPEAENRGFGLSTNIKMITNGLNGDLAIMSGNALFVASIDKLIELPEQSDWKGTLILASFPLDIPSSFDFYNYI